MQVYGVSTSSSVRLKTLSSIAKFVHFANPDLLKSLLKDISISR